MRKTAVVGLSAVALMLALACIPAYASTDAAVNPMTISLFDSQGSVVNGDLFDKEDVDVSTDTDFNTGTTTYTIGDHTPLISDTRYLMISPENAGDCVFTMTAVRESGFVTESGITFAFYDSTSYSQSSCVGELTFANDTQEKQTLSGLLTAGRPYYIRAWTTSDYSMTDIAPTSQYVVDYTMTATTADGVNALYYHANDGTTVDPFDSKLVTNGQVYGEPPTIKKEGQTLLGWFTDPALGEAVHPNDTVNLTGEQHLYAHWIKDHDVIHVDENGNEEWIWIDAVDDNVHVKIDGKSKTTRIVTVYDNNVLDGRIDVETKNTAQDFTIQDAKDANEQYSVIRQVLSERGLIVDNHIVIKYGNSVSCEEGSLNKLLETQCNDFRVVGDDLTISMDRTVIGNLKDLTGETVIETSIAPPERLTEEQKKVIGDAQAFDIKVTNNGEEIEGFTGVITAWFTYDGPCSSDKMQVYSVGPDGSVGIIPFTYKDGVVTFTTSHLSIFYLKTEASQNAGDNWMIYVIFGSITLMVGAAVFLAIKRYRRRREVA